MEPNPRYYTSSAINVAVRARLPDHLKDREIPEISPESFSEGVREILATERDMNIPRAEEYLLRQVVDHLFTY